ncbi:hypothetical protein EV193_101429 [Herbihabitans rhizosphaerae]|uniref:DUF2127 domain-containing protein n=1 Tax=Herbihabitans rhizosphaerae TaxID=1872711 RepID=A0A4V2EUH1_9PSEU|nr:hypothetical protein [Herbihabitans rhizosphaerae]RZS44553.1 hypothetical protein EV193_101429 [Herbihabitans rhizosphaerae]
MDIEPAPPPSDRELPKQPERPKAIDTAFLLALGGVAISIVSTLLTMVIRDKWANDYARQFLDGSGKAFTDADVANLVSTIKPVAAVAVFVGAGIAALFVYKMRAGRNWARIVLTVFAIFGAMGLFSVLVEAGAPLDMMWDVAQVAFSVAAVVYMFKPESTEYFNQTKRARQRS